ncbi:MAG: NAD-dependent epimerase/dehydratase family protein [Pseudomonadota bacterium]
MMRLGLQGRLLVTGGAGFIGRALCRRLVADGYAVTVLDDLSTGDARALPPGVTLIEADICDRAALCEALADVDGVFHLAAVSSVEACLSAPAAASRTNLQGTVTLLEEASGRPVVHASSAAVYGEQSALPIRETATPDPMSPYAVDKLASEGHLALAASLRGERTVALRLFNVYGPGQPPHVPYAGVIARFAARALAGHTLRIQGDGAQVRDFVHLDDVIEALISSMAYIRGAPAGEHLCANVCSGEAVTVLDVARALSRIAGQGAPIEFTDRRPGDIRHSLGDPTRARQVLGLEPTRGLESGLQNVVDHLSVVPIRARFG